MQNLPRQSLFPRPVVRVIAREKATPPVLRQLRSTRLAQSGKARPCLAQSKFLWRAGGRTMLGSRRRIVARRSGCRYLPRCSCLGPRGPTMAAASPRDRHAVAAGRRITVTGPRNPPPCTPVSCLGRSRRETFWFSGKGAKSDEKNRKKLAA
jgi:hypothetical protein